jgi:energy-coupling factor transporter ATP-binding protein EcfA2
MVDALTGLRDTLRDVELPLRLPDVTAAETARTEVLDQIDDYVLPRLARLDAPLLAVLGGSTGAGKSTITNSLVGREVTSAGVLRPTTRTPVLVCHPDDEHWFRDGGVLPALARTTGARPESGSGLHVVTADALPAGLAVLDSPDIDSIEVANHELASQLLGAADLWLFVTTAVRYADAVPWDYLARAAERAVALAVIINRVPPGAEEEVQAHLAEMLAERGLGDARLIAVTESAGGGMLGPEIDPVRDWLLALVADAGHRNALVRRTLDGVLASLPGRVARVATAVEQQAAAAGQLGQVAERRHADALDAIERGLLSGALLRGEVLDRFREQVGTGELMDRLQRGVGRVRDRVAATLTGRPLPVEEVQGAIESTLELLVREEADAAALDVVQAWQGLPGGRDVLAGADAVKLSRSSPDLVGRLDEELAAWQGQVFDLVEQTAGNKVAVGRVLSWGINSVGVALMVAVFAHTGGITGGEVAVAGGTATVSQAVLSAVFGEQAVRSLVEESRHLLLVRLDGVLETEAGRFRELLGAVPAAETAHRLQAAARGVVAG